MHRDDKISLIFNTYFSSIVSSLNIPRYHNSLVNFVTIEGPFDQQWEKQNNHLSNLPVLNTQFENIFFFIGNVSEVEIENEISSMTEKKASEQFHIASKVITRLILRVK